MQEDKFQNVKKIDPRWMERLKQLKAYYHEYGDCNVSQGYKDNPSLAIWVANQRSRYKRGRLTPEKIKLLNELGFDWDRHATQWKKMYGRLKAYFEQNNHSDVPCRYYEDPTLEKWVQTQRHAYKRGLLEQEKVDLLNQLNFVWKK